MDKMTDTGVLKISTDGVNKARIELWCEALESGRYHQGGGVLRNRTGYCCLGVACDVMDSTRWTPPDTSEDVIYTYEHEASFLPQSVVEWYGLDGQSPLAIARDGCRWKLATMNDAMLLSFETIAEALRRTYLQRPTDEASS